MNEQQRSMYEQKERLDYLERERETETQMRAQQQAQAELEGRFQSLQQTHNIDQDRREYLTKELQEIYKAEVTPENLVELHSSLVRLDRVDNALKQINPELLEDDSKVLTLESLVKGSPTMSDDELRDLAAKLYGDDVSKAVANLTKKTAKKEPAPKVQPLAPVVGVNSIDFFNN